MDRKRQQRGVERTESLLDSAAQVFAEVGYKRATTNLIAARAKVSHGSLYQFSPHKAARAAALATRYESSFETVHTGVFVEGIERLELRQFIDFLVGPFLNFHRAAPAFEALLLAGAKPGPTGTHIISLKTAFSKTLAGLFVLRHPGSNPKEVKMAAEVSLEIFSGLLPMVVQGSPAVRRRAGALPDARLDHCGGVR